LSSPLDESESCSSSHPDGIRVSLKIRQLLLADRYCYEGESHRGTGPSAIAANVRRRGLVMYRSEIFEL